MNNHTHQFYFLWIINLKKCIIQNKTQINHFKDQTFICYIFVTFSHFKFKLKLYSFFEFTRFGNFRNFGRFIWTFLSWNWRNQIFLKFHTFWFICILSWTWKTEKNGLVWGYLYRTLTKTCNHFVLIQIFIFGFVHLKLTSWVCGEILTYPNN